MLLESLNQFVRRNALSRGLRAALFGAAILGTCAANAQPAGPPPPRPGGPPPPANPLMATQEGAGAAIQRAYDAIGRSAIMVESSHAQGSGDLLDRSRNAYQQALTAYQASNFVAAQESGLMATDLAHAADELSSARLFDTSQAKVNPPPQSMGGPDPAARVYDDLGRLAQHRADIEARIGATPDAADRTLLDESGRLQQDAQNLLNNQKPQEAGAMARAADALLAACDHSIQRVLIASGRLAAPFAPAPGGPEPPPPPPQP